MGVRVGIGLSLCALATAASCSSAPRESASVRAEVDLPSGVPSVASCGVFGLKNIQSGPMPLVPGETAAATPAEAIAQAQQGKPAILFTRVSPLAAGIWYRDGSDGEALRFVHVSDGRIDAEADVDVARGGGWIYTGGSPCG